MNTEEFKKCFRQSNSTSFLTACLIYPWFILNMNAYIAQYEVLHRKIQKYNYTILYIDKIFSSINANE